MREVDATMVTMSTDPHVTHVPVMTGGHGTDAVRRFYETWFIGHWPEDAKITLVSWTVGETQLGGRTDPLLHPRLRDAGHSASSSFRAPAKWSLRHLSGPPGY